MTSNLPVPDLFQARVVFEGGKGEWVNVTAEQAVTLRAEPYRNHYQVRALFAVPEEAPDGFADIPATAQLRAEGVEDGWLPNCLITMGVNADGRVIFDRVLTTVNPAEDYERMVRAVEAANLQSAAYAVQRLQPPREAEMNVALENMDVSTPEGVKGFVRWAFDCANASAPLQP